MLLGAFYSVNFVLILHMFPLRRGGGNDKILIGDDGKPYEDQIHASVNVRAGQTSCLYSSILLPVDHSLLLHSHPPPSSVSISFPES